MERTFQTYSPLLESIEIKRRGAVRQAKLYYLRERSGRSARIKKKLRSKLSIALSDLSTNSETRFVIRAGLLHITIAGHSSVNLIQKRQIDLVLILILAGD